MKQQLSITKTNLDVDSLDIDLANFTNARLYRICRIVNRITTCGSAFLTIEIEDEELSDPSANIVVLASILHEKHCSQYIIWEDAVWSVVNATTMTMLSNLANVSLTDLQETSALLHASQRQTTDTSSKSSPAR